MDLPLTIQPIEKYTVVEFRTPSLMDPIILENIATALYRLIEVEDHRQIILDFEQVQYLSSQALGILMGMRKKLEKLKHSKLILCGVGPTLLKLLKIACLDKVLTIKPSQKEALKVLIP
jgi:anti-anti-sigma factor